MGRTGGKERHPAGPARAAVVQLRVRSKLDDRPPSRSALRWAGPVRELALRSSPTRQSRRAKEGGKSELRRAVRRVTPGQGDLKESGTENIPLAFAGSAWRRRVRVKRCGKSAPRLWQHGWQAKPRTEQDQIGKRLRTARPKLPGRSLDPASNGGTRGMIVAAPGPQRSGRNRIRLMARCEHSTHSHYLDLSALQPEWQP